MRRALITGITGQDGSYLAEWLLARGYEVHGTHRPASSNAPAPLAALGAHAAGSGQRLFLHAIGLDDPAAWRRLCGRVQPDEVYHLAGQSHVGSSFERVESTCESTAMGTLRLLEILRDQPHPVRLFHASSSEVFGRPETEPQDERTPFAPVTPYGCAKTFATHLVATFRRAYGLFGCNGILYNHESPRRGEGFVTRKICRAAAAIKAGKQTELRLGDLQSQRDWGHARDYVRGMWLTLQAGRPDDYVFATGQLHRVEEVVEIAFATCGLPWRDFVTSDPALLRPAEPQRLVGSAAKAQRELGWVPEITFTQMIEEMTRAELALHS